MRVGLGARPQRLLRHGRHAFALAVLATGLVACTPPPSAWPVGGAQPLPLGGSAVEAYAAGIANESGGSVPADVGAGYQARAGELLTIGGAAGMYRTESTNYGHLRAFGKLHLTDGALAPILGVGAGSNFDGVTYGAADLALAAGLRLGAWELYGAPGVGLSVPIEATWDETTLFPGAALGASARVTERWSCGAEGLLAAIVLLENELDATWSAGFGLFVRYAFGPASERPSLLSAGQAQ